MENKNMLDVVFHLNYEVYGALSEDAKMELLLVIQDLVDSEMKKLILTTNIPEA